MKHGLSVKKLVLRNGDIGVSKFYLIYLWSKSMTEINFKDVGPSRPTNRISYTGKYRTDLSTFHSSKLFIVN